MRYGEWITALTLGQPLILVDVGARNTAPLRGKSIYKYGAFFGFEPSPQSQDKVVGVRDLVEKAMPKANTMTTYPVALGNIDGPVELHLSRRPGATSTLIPNEELLRRFAPDHWSEMREIVETITVPCMRLKTFLEVSGLPYIDFLKLDTQGTELDILRSAEERLKDVGVVKAEVEFAQMYEGQELAHDTMAFMHEQGFELLDIEWTEPCRRFHVNGSLPYSKYRLIWGDAVFVRHPYEFDDPATIRKAIVLADLGYKDMALYLLQNAGDSPEIRQASAEVARLPRMSPLGWCKFGVKYLLQRLTPITFSKNAYLNKQVSSQAKAR